VLGLTVTGLETGTFALLAREVTPKSKGSQGDKRRTGKSRRPASVKIKVPWSCKRMCRDFYEGDCESGCRDSRWRYQRDAGLSLFYSLSLMHKGYPPCLPHKYLNAIARCPFLIASPSQRAINEIMRYRSAVLAARSSGSRTTDLSGLAIGSMSIGFNA
jgi:hypothetical protein